MGVALKIEVFPTPTPPLPTRGRVKRMLAVPSKRRNMLYKYLFLEQDSRFADPGADSVRNDLALAKGLALWKPLT